MEIDGIVAMISFAALVIVWAFAPNTPKEVETTVAAPAQQKVLA